MSTLQQYGYQYRYLWIRRYYERLQFCSFHGGQRSSWTRVDHPRMESNPRQIHSSYWTLLWLSCSTGYIVVILYSYYYLFICSIWKRTKDWSNIKTSLRVYFHNVKSCHQSRSLLDLSRGCYSKQRCISLAPMSENNILEWAQSVPSSICVCYNPGKSLRHNPSNNEENQ